MCLDPVSLVSVMDFPNMGLEAGGLGLFWFSSLCALKVGDGVAVSEFPCNGGGLNPI